MLRDLGDEGPHPPPVAFPVDDQGGRAIVDPIDAPEPLLEVEPGRGRLADLLQDQPIAMGGIAVDVSPETNTIPPFKNMALRLKVGEIGIVKTDFGIHIVQRIE